MTSTDRKDQAELLERVADKLEYRGILPASDVEKLRVLANEIKNGAQRI